MSPTFKKLKKLGVKVDDPVVWIITNSPSPTIISSPSIVSLLLLSISKNWSSDKGLDISFEDWDTLPSIPLTKNLDATPPPSPVIGFPFISK